MGDNTTGGRLLAKYILFAGRVTYGSGSVTGSMSFPRHPASGFGRLFRAVLCVSESFPVLRRPKLLGRTEQ
jgi:hypothetical protein